MIEIELKAPSIVLPNTPLVIHVNLVNKADKPVEWSCQLSLGISSQTDTEAKVAEAAMPDPMFHYSWKVMETSAGGCGMTDMLTIVNREKGYTPPFQDATSMYGRGAVSLIVPAHDSNFTACCFKDGLEAGKYEFHVEGTCYDKVSKQYVSIYSKYIIVDVKPDAKVVPVATKCTAKAEIVSENVKGTVFKVTVKNTSREEVELPVFETGKAQQIGGVVLAYDQDGRSVFLGLAGATRDMYKWKKRTLKPGEEVACEYSVVPREPFQPKPISKYVVMVFPKGEMLRTEFAVQKDLSWVAPPEFGAALDGVGMRVRTEEPEYYKGDNVRVYFQIRNASGKPRYMRSEPETGTNITKIYIDDKAVDVALTYMQNWLDGPSELYDGLVDVSPVLTTAQPGWHTIRLVYSNKDGDEPKAGDQDQRKYLKGEISSNTYKYFVKDKERE
jgi:hypothetical protein